MTRPSHSASTNPCIPRGDGAGPVAAYIAAIPGWKQAVGRQVDEIVGEVLPSARKQVRWNTPFWGNEAGWFLAMYCYRGYVQLSFLTGAALKPPPPKPSKVEGLRYLDIPEHAPLDRDQLTDWVRQAAALPGKAL